MTNQAAQTMPELPEPYKKGRKEIPGAGKWDIDCGAGPDLYTADQMHQYARDYAAALAAPQQERPHPDALPDGTLSKSTAKRVTALAAASVSERARELRERAEAHGGGVFVSVGDIRAIEQALTQRITEYRRGIVDAQFALHDVANRRRHPEAVAFAQELLDRLMSAYNAASVGASQ